MKRIMRKLVLLIAAVLASTGLVVLASSPAHAEGIPGCDNADQKWRWMLKTETEDRWYNDPYILENYHVRLSVSTKYLYCQGSDWRVKPKTVEYCVSFLDGSWGGLLYNETAFDTFYRNTGPEPEHVVTIDTPTTIVDDDNSSQNCKTHNIPASEEAWLRSGGWHFYKVTAWIRLRDVPNVEVIFTENGTDDKLMLRPYESAILGPWHYA